MKQFLELLSLLTFVFFLGLQAVAFMAGVTDPRYKCERWPATYGGLLTLAYPVGCAFGDWISTPIGDDE